MLRHLPHGAVVAEEGHLRGAAQLSRGSPGKAMDLIDSSGAAAFAEFLKRGEPLCGRLLQDKLDALFADKASTVQSAVLLPIGDLGMLAIGSLDANRFHPGMGTVFLRLIAEAVSTAVTRYSGTR